MAQVSDGGFCQIGSQIFSILSQDVIVAFYFCYTETFSGRKVDMILLYTDAFANEPSIFLTYYNLQNSISYKENSV